MDKGTNLFFGMLARHETLFESVQETLCTAEKLMRNGKMKPEGAITRAILLSGPLFVGGEVREHLMGLLSEKEKKSTDSAVIKKLYTQMFNKKMKG